ncbi:flagellar motor protein MotB [Erwinia amylovora]|uniref:Chemotaxis protein motB (Motility protein B) n=4 Tax=Erwinia amylovora TaxID=552 RepID=A0A831EKM4_ERWAM|nr:flagellar motor protein MotB [Erwinia amylovora]CBX81533.1 Chemotaxis protein motB (Motility protein B) [Erwinia amylovora ATCC BAA-2158]CCP03967.1 Chemotaxis protein motB (Motility protein B) [Erwinia amylovora Ea644]CDK16043.1 Chemotaxis protein motB (Motility protein B) [Erwinia amylovora LA635]CDK19410.1 Chemotaxis protein motB (Motility protein B) [Erwinia amylovora LA636]CDK22781.1 Chemotaxis protein motB (Motility protein B) [Erwinia amylovora LA637]
MKATTPIIRQRKRKHKKHAHHGGTWKIAYADFMTAMMAFFLVMWLLASSSDMQREMIADYFRMPIKPTMGQGNKTSFSESIIPGGGDDVIRQEGEVYKHQVDKLDKFKNVESLKKVKTRLETMIESDPRLSNFKSNLMLTLTDDGLMIQITDSQERPMFKTGSEAPESYMNGILQALVPLLKELPNSLSLTGHTDSLAYAGGSGGYSNWELSTGRANAARRVLINAGLDDDRILRVIGTGSRMGLADISADNPMNRRISVLVLSKLKERQVLEENSILQQTDSVLPLGTSVSAVQGYTDGSQ